VVHRNQTSQLYFQTPKNLKNQINFIILFSKSLFKCRCLLHNQNSVDYQFLNFKKFAVLIFYLFFNDYQNCFYRIIFLEMHKVPEFFLNYYLQKKYFNLLILFIFSLHNFQKN